MKKSLSLATNRRSLLYCLFGLSFIFTVDGCQGCRRSKRPDNLDAIKGANSVNVVLTDNLSDGDVRTRFSKILDKNGKSISDLVHIKRCPCDAKLINIGLPDGFTFEGHGGDVAVRPPAGGSGGDVDLPGFGTIAVNLELSLANTVDSTDTVPGARIPFLMEQQSAKAGSVKKNVAIEPVKIAILDSGFNPTYFSKDWQIPTTTCDANAPQSTSNRGWNFITNPVSTTTDDDQVIQHGTRVALLAAQQFAQSDVPVKIVPMKVLNAENKGDLFSILCAMETARQNNVTIINMSLGYYGDRNALFEEYVKRCTDKHIWVVVAAGNEKSIEDKRDLSSRTPTFYPAMFGETNKRVIAVTTVNKGQACERQNFDPDFVVGVEQDANCRFSLIDGDDNLLIFGTSYATPIMAGWLGRSMHDKSLPPGSLLPAIAQKMDDSNVKGSTYLGKTITRQKFSSQ